MILRRVIDASDRFANRERLNAWLRANGIDPNATFRVELYPFRFLRAHQFALDAKGRKYLDGSGTSTVSDLARCPPVIVHANSRCPV